MEMGPQWTCYNDQQKQQDNHNRFISFVNIYHYQKKQLDINVTINVKSCKNHYGMDIKYKTV